MNEDTLSQCQIFINRLIEAETGNKQLNVKPLLKRNRERAYKELLEAARDFSDLNLNCHPDIERRVEMVELNLRLNQHGSLLKLVRKHRDEFGKMINRDMVAIHGLVEWLGKPEAPSPFVAISRDHPDDDDGESKKDCGENVVTDGEA